ncbi:arginine-ornithine antiporter [Haematospirillum sp. 15-248]|uniref:arginine-ornithine antiporter n=1 Tax=Haematospirillum sp. 15-248 TaxID=2723107 RepID=UPI001FD82F7A|nr:arginine-ornithine antiporter [Haematospirillum sp. 15-248]
MTKQAGVLSPGDLEMVVQETAPSRSGLRLGALTALVVGSMIGGGIFALPQNTASSAAPGAMLIGWTISALGMLALAWVFRLLADRRADLDGGIYAYARAGFGNYVGFLSAWGYWISAWIGTTSYLVLLLSTLGYFFPVFGDGNTLWAVIAASALLWAVHAMVLRGITGAVLANQVATVAKVIPLILFVIIAATAFQLDIFTTDIWGAGSTDLGSVMDQVRNMMLITVWVFIGIEGAGVYSARARRRSDVGKATVLGFLGVMALLVSVNVLSMGIMSRAELAGLKDPSMAYVLESVVGPWGAVLVSVGLVISLLGGLLAWMLLCTEILFSASKGRSMPAFLRQENANRVPANALFLSNVMIQIFLVLTLFNESTYLALASLGTSMILVPYLLSAVFALRCGMRGELYGHGVAGRRRAMCVTGLAALYSLWLLYAAGVDYLLLSALLYTPGIVLYVQARRELREPVFRRREGVLFSLLLAGAVVAGSMLYAGYLSL